jgi:hypothetical protein
MTDHPHAAALDQMATHVRADDWADAAVLRAGAAALRALAAFRPHHPQAIVGRRYATLVVPFEALMAAREALGDHDLGPVDVLALRQLHDDDRQKNWADIGSEAVREKWGAKL